MLSSRSPYYTLCLPRGFSSDWSHGTVVSAAMMVALKRVEQDNNCIGCHKRLKSRYNLFWIVPHPVHQPETLKLGLSKPTLCVSINRWILNLLLAGPVLSSWCVCGWAWPAQESRRTDTIYPVTEWPCLGNRTVVKCEQTTTQRHCRLVKAVFQVDGVIGLYCLLFSQGWELVRGHQFDNLWVHFVTSPGLKWPAPPFHAYLGTIC